MIEIKKRLNIERKGNELICNSTNAVVVLMGATSVIGNYDYYGVKKQGNKFIVPISKVNERIRVLTGRRDALDETIGLMEQILAEAKNGKQKKARKR